MSPKKVFGYELSTHGLVMFRAVSVNFIKRQDCESLVNIYIFKQHLIFIQYFCFVHGEHFSTYRDETVSLAGTEFLKSYWSKTADTSGSFFSLL
jgi:hypothetical protein